ncbi:MAG: DNA-3-methyladenine glycosylase [Bacteroidota bacterium]|nr:DNA-3-methyladenine glycosylase [Bacteroidota bacterium]
MGISLEQKKLKILPRPFYLRSTLTVAKDLLGKYLVRKINKNLLVGKIVEVEAYLGENDPASHAYRGRTKRNDVMFWRGGHLYVYFTYGMHFCANIVTEEEGKGRAVLLRAVEPIKGIEIMKRNREIKRRNGRRLDSSRLLESACGGWNDVSKRVVVNLTNGPAKLCEAFGLKREQNGTDLLGDSIFLTFGGAVPKSQTRADQPTAEKIVSTTRIGINNGKEKRWRFYIKDSPFVSKTYTPEAYPSTSGGRKSPG